MAGDAAAAARSFDEQLAAAVARAQSAVSAAEAPEKTDEQIVEAHGPEHVVQYDADGRLV